MTDLVTGAEARVAPSVLDPAPQTPDRPPRLTPVGYLRYGWRYLTSMRTALVLLFLLALAAVPGSLLPQRGQDPTRVVDFFRTHRTLAPILDRLSLFDVFAAPWFAAIYLLLFISLTGCVLPRSWRHLRLVTARPPKAPKRLERLPRSAAWEVARASGAEPVESVRRILRGRRYRVDVHDEGDGVVAVSAEKGYLRETGNLVFHLALLVLLAGVAMGGLFGYHGTVLVVEGQGFANVLGSYDSFHPGRLFSSSNLAPFTINLNRFHAVYDASADKRGEALDFDAYVSYRDKPGASLKKYDVRVNDPLRFGTTKVYLVGHGYAPHFVVRDGDGNIAFNGSVPFLPQDGNFTSNGVVKVPDAKPTQLGFAGFFTPTTVATPSGLTSSFPGPRNPAVTLLAYTGNLGLDSGVPQSVYSLDDKHLTRVGAVAMGIGDTYTLPDHKGSITFTGFQTWATFQTTYDPGKGVALAAAVLMIAGLLMSLRIKRSRVWVRLRPGGSGARMVVEVAGLARDDATGFQADFDELRAQLAAELDPDSPSTPAADPDKE